MTLVQLDVIDLSVTCTDCGKCCSTMRTPPHMVWYRDGEYKKMDSQEWFARDYKLLMSAPKEAREERLAGVFSDRPVLAPCSWLDPVTKQCRWYECRPGICRDFVVGSKPCLEWRNENKPQESKDDGNSGRDGNESKVAKDRADATG